MSGKKVVTLLLIGIMVLGLFGTAIAQETETTKLLRYNSEKKEPWIAVLGAWFMPSLGHYYAGDWGRSLPKIGVQAAGLGLYIAGLSQTTTSSTTSSGTSLALGGLIVLLGGRIWEYFDAYSTAEDYNRSLQKKYSLTLNIYNNQPALQVSYQF